MDARVEQGTERAHLQLEVVDRILFTGCEEDLDHFLFIERRIAPPVCPPGMIVGAIEADVERRIVPTDPHDGRPLGRSAVGSEDQRRKAGKRVPGAREPGYPPAREGVGHGLIYACGLY